VRKTPLTARGAARPGGSPVGHAERGPSFRFVTKATSLSLVRRLARPSVALLLALGTSLCERASEAQIGGPSAASATAAPTDSATATVAVTSPAAVAPVSSAFFPEAPAEAPPPLPRKKGLVLESGIGGLAFLGKFGDLAPPAPWFHTQLGWEFFNWLMLYAYGELAYTGTSSSQDELAEIDFPIYGFGGGLRFTVHVSDRVALYLQANAGAMSAIVPRDSLTFLGYQAAESPGFAVGGRLGVDWYQLDRHMALSLGVGMRDAFNFKIQDGESDLPLMLDASVALRYTF
jgi:hypothetical protein